MAFKGFNPFHDRLAGYMPADEEVGSTSYYGYLDTDGNWYIQKSVRTGNEMAHTYAKGTSDYETNWTNRATASVTYAAFSDTF